jgi:oligoendopeptidase F
MTTSNTLPKRDAIDPAETWNRESVFPNREAWEEAATAFPERIPGLAAYRGRLHEGPQVLAEFRQQAEQAQRDLMKLYFYALMEQSVNSHDQAVNAMVGRVGALLGQLSATLSFSNPEMLAIGQETLEQWIAEEPALGDMKMYVDNLFRQQAHVRSDEVEQVLGMVADPFSSSNRIYDSLTSQDMDFQPATDSQGNERAVAQATIDTLMNDPDREIRRTAYERYYDGYLAMKNTIASTYITSVKQDVFRTRTRGYESSLHASLFNNNIPVEVFHNLIDTFKKNLPTWHKYWAVRRKALGVESLQPYDIWAPIAEDQPRVAFEQAVDWISSGLQPLGDDYVTAMRQGTLEDRWVDRAVNAGKRQGAFSFGTYDTSPFIMMSYDGTMGAMSTLAHELGHSMHSYLSRKTQPYINASYTLFAAEVASNFNQAMTRAYLREQNEDPNFQIALIEEAMDNFHRYFLIMPTLARFEHEVHQRVEKGQAPTADDMMTLCADLFGEAYGDAMQYDRERVGMTWGTFQHLYQAYYTYSYATGISAAHELAKNILAGEPGAAERYVGFLQAGGSQYPIDALAAAGVDMTQPDAVETTFAVLADMVDQLEALIDAR